MQTRSTGQTRQELRAEQRSQEAEEEQGTQGSRKEAKEAPAGLLQKASKRQWPMILRGVTLGVAYCSFTLLGTKSCERARTHEKSYTHCVYTYTCIQIIHMSYAYVSLYTKNNPLEAVLTKA